MNFQKINNIAGWAVFAIATITYLLTLEMTASYWDCGEFIAVSYKLMVPHPPGAPFFLLVGRMFSFLALGDVTQVAYWINVVSVLSSSFSILFLFWSIVMLARKVLKVNIKETVSLENTILLIGAGAVGALAYTFSDTFWFSAVEAEVYAMSSFFTAFVFWAILKWDLMEDESQANRWIILIAYMMGLSIGVHLLNLVTIPALGLIYYFKKYKPSTWGLVACMGISGGLIILINNLIIPGLPSIASSFEIFFVNNLGLPFGSGAIVFALLVIGSLIAGIIYSIKKEKEILNTALLSLAFILIGYSSYTLVVIRSNYNPPIDENNPEDIMSFVKYLNREQYGYRPLFKGQYFTAQVTGQEEGGVVYTKGEDKYEITDRKFSYVYDQKQTTLLPRIYSTTPAHQQLYREKLGLKKGEVPNFIDNIRFLLSHQLGWMYYRYFMWNFSGRVSDMQNADWLSPLGAFEELPSTLAENKARNNYFMIPLLLGIIGLVFHYVNDKKNFAVVAMLFFLTGIALILYLNSPPSEPRERDYIYVASFYAFAIWIGFGVVAIGKSLGKFLSPKTAGSVALAIGLIAPTIMVAENWDDHDRSNRFFSVDIAKNFLSSCSDNAIMFTGGDNDTFPLWYVQNVEDFATDMRVLVLSYSNTDWYIEQMLDKHYGSEPVPLTLTMKNYRQGGPNDYLPYAEELGVKGAINLHTFINLLKKEDKRLRLYESANVIPSKTISLDVDKQSVLSKGIIPKGMENMVVDQMIFKLKGGGLEKKDLMILDLIATNNWERPIYFNNTSLSQLNIDVEDYVIQEGNAYRLLPVKNPSSQQRARMVNTDIMYENVMTKFQFRELDNPNSYYNEDYRNFVVNHRSTINTLAETLLNEGKQEKAREVLLYSLEKMPDISLHYDFTSVQTADMLFRLGEDEKAMHIVKTLADRSEELVSYYVGENVGVTQSLRINILILQEIIRTLKRNGEAELANQYEAALEGYYSVLESQSR
ncbi:MAG: DUF2723 domain-containing protein [Cyclobacteriaceae bacterium]|nr:DUF2723 domain-containing protein [Cyclobacteriaceae bacterium]